MRVTITEEKPYKVIELVNLLEIVKNVYGCDPCVSHMDSVCCYAVNNIHYVPYVPNNDKRTNTLKEILNDLIDEDHTRIIVSYWDLEYIIQDLVNLEILEPGDYLVRT